MKKAIFVLIVTLVCIPSVFATIFEDIDEIEIKVQEYLDNRDPLVIEGKYSTYTQKKGYDYFKTKFTDIEKAKYIQEFEVNERELLSRDTIVLLGGPNQNQYTKKYFQNPNFESEQINASVATVIFLTNKDQRILIFTEISSLNNLPRTVIDKSPLNKYLPREYVPAAATVIGFTLLALWNVLVIMFTEIFKSKVGEELINKIKKNKIEKHFKGFTLGGVKFKAREWGTILLAALIVALSLSYMYLAPDMNTISFFFLVAFLNLCIAAIAHGTRLVLDKYHDLHTEYTLWKVGALLTIITSWLGNTFSLAGYIRTGHSDNIKNEGRVAYMTNCVIFLIFIITYFVNLTQPKLWLQMTSLLALTTVFVQMLPLQPYEGKAIYAWNKVAWFITMVPLVIVYIMVHLIV